MRSSEGCSARQSMYSSKDDRLVEAAPVEVGVGHGALARGAGPRRSGRGAPPGPPRGCRAACRSCASASARRGRAMKSKPPEPTSGSRLRAQNSRTLGSMAAILRGVKTRDRRPRWRSWSGGSSKMIEPGRDLHAALDELEDRALGRAVGPPVDQGPLDVVEAAQRVEVVALVVVERRSSRSRLQHRVRVGVDLEVVRVVVQVGTGRGHVGALRPERGTDVTLEQEAHSHLGQEPRMRIGVMVGPERGRYSTKVDRMRADVRWAEEAGLASVWIPQIPDDFDALTAAALLGAETEPDRDRHRGRAGAAPPPDRAGPAGAVGAGGVRGPAGARSRRVAPLGDRRDARAALRAAARDDAGPPRRARRGARGSRAWSTSRTSVFRVHNPLDITDVTPDPGPDRRARPADAEAGRRADGRHHPLDGRREGDRVAHRSHPDRGGRGRGPARAPHRRGRAGLPVPRRRGRGGGGQDQPHPLRGRGLTELPEAPRARRCPQRRRHPRRRQRDRRSRSGCSPSPMPA